MVCRTLYSTIFVFIAFAFDHSCFRHRHLKFQVPCIDSVFGVTVYANILILVDIVKCQCINMVACEWVFSV